MTTLDLVVVQPLDTIEMWSGSLIDIPDGWQLCDGTNGTPNLIDKFVIGAPDATDPGDEGGEKEHTLSVAEMPNHSHGTFSTGGGFHWHNVSSIVFKARIAPDDNNMSPGSAGQSPYPGWNPLAGLWSIGVTGGSPHENRPPYFELAYIMRLS